MTDTIHTAMLAIMNEVSYIQKERSKDVKYTLKTENAVIQAIRPAMVKHGVYMFPVAVKDVEHSQFEAGQYKNIWNRIVATHVYRFVHAESQTHIDVEVLGDGADTGDKAGNKSMTTSKKYALLEAFLLETGDDPENTPSTEMERKAPEKKQPAQSGNDDTITDDAWSKFGALLKRADDNKVVVQEYNRKEMTLSQLRAEYKKIEAQIKKAGK